MENLKIRVNSADESREAQELFLKYGATGNICLDQSIRHVCTFNGVLTQYDFLPSVEFKQITLPELRAMVNPMREYLDANRNYEFVLSTEKDDGFIEIPEGMNFAYKDDMYTHFTKMEMGYRDASVIWQRDQDEPFLTPETTLNDQYAEIEQVRQQTIDATLTERQSQYGCYEDVAHVTQQILSALRVGNYDELPAPMKESLHMIASKMARIVNGDPEYLDNWHDIGGYAKLIEKLIKGE